MKSIIIKLVISAVFCMLCIQGETSSNYRHAYSYSASSVLALPQDDTPATPITEKQLEEAHVNEVGLIPILEYHEISTPAANAGYATRMMHRSIAQFRRDLNRLYVEGYRPISMHDYLNNKIDLPLGTSPVILTFDDARGTQFRFQKDGKISPYCAVGILQEFASEHPDFPVKAMFYVLPDGAFSSSDEGAKRKLRALLKMGCELGNHTLNHNYFNRMSNAGIIKEIALGKSVTERMAPGANLDTLALPGGCKPRSHNYRILMSGSYKGIRYTNRAVIDAWGGPAPSPVSRKFNPYHIPRVLAATGSDGLNYYLDYLKRHPEKRYFSDGDVDKVTVPKRLASLVDSDKLGDAELRIYDASTTVSTFSVRKSASIRHTTTNN